MTNSIALADYVFQSDETVKTTSLNVAKAFDKKHSDVLRKIDEICTQVSDIFEKRNFAPLEIERTNNLGKIVKDRAYELTKDGFMLLVMGFTGKKAMQTKIAFIEAFNWMAGQLGIKENRTTSIQRTELRQAVTEAAAKLQMMHSDVYSSVHKNFNVHRIEEIPLAELPEAVAFVKALHGQYIACSEQADAARREKIVYRRAAVMMMALGKLYHQKQRRLLREAKETVDKLHELMREIEECNGAISDGVSESQLYLCFDNQVVREGREMAYGRFALRHEK